MLFGGNNRKGESGAQVLRSDHSANSFDAQYIRCAQVRQAQVPRWSMRCSASGRRRRSPQSVFRPATSAARPTHDRERDSTRRISFSLSLSPGDTLGVPQLRVYSSLAFRWFCEPAKVTQRLTEVHVPELTSVPTYSEENVHLAWSSAQILPLRSNFSVMVQVPK